MFEVLVREAAEQHCVKCRTVVERVILVGSAGPFCSPDCALAALNGGES